MKSLHAVYLVRNQPSHADLWYINRATVGSYSLTKLVLYFIQKASLKFTLAKFSPLIMLADARMECCEVEPRYTIEQIDLLQRLRLSGMTKPQIIHALESLERLDPDRRPSQCDSHPAPSNNTPTTAAPAPSSSSSSSSSSLSLASATTQTSGLDGAALSPSHSYEASPPPLYPPTVAVQRSFSYDMMGEEEWDLEEKVEEYMR